MIELAFSKEEIDHKFRDTVQKKVFRQFKKNPDLNACLYLIGIRELGQAREKFSKEEKQDLMHIAICKLLSELGYYSLEGLDADGWPHWIAVKTFPKISIDEQEYLLKQQIIRYFDTL